MKYVVTRMPHVTDLTTAEMRTYFYEDVRVAEIWPNFGNVRISGEHPFASLYDQEVNGKTVPIGLFPAITVICGTDQKYPPNELPYILSDVVIGDAEVADMAQPEAERRERYIVSEATIKALQQLRHDGVTIRATGTTAHRRLNFTLEIWAEQTNIRDRLFDLSLTFLTGPRRLQLKEDYDIVVADDTVTGERSASYNFDFGKILYGGVMNCAIDYSIGTYIVDTDILLGTEVHHFVQEVHDHNG
jgi:hypothetical protein